MATTGGVEFSQYFGEGFKLENRTFIVRHGLVSRFNGPDRYLCISRSGLCLYVYAGRVEREASDGD